MSTCTFGIVITFRTLPEKGATTWVSIFMASRTARRSPTATVSPALYRDGNDHRGGRSVHHASVVSIDLMRHAIDFNARTSRPRLTETT